MKVIVCKIVDDVSCHSSVGVGATEDAAKEDAIRHFFERSADVIRRRIESGAATVNYEVHKMTPAPAASGEG